MDGDGNDNKVKKSSIRLYRDAINDAFNEERESLVKRMVDLNNRFNNAVKTYGDELRVLVAVAGSLRSLDQYHAGAAPEPFVHIVLPKDVSEKFPVGLRREVEAAKAAWTDINGKYVALHTKEMGLINRPRDEVVKALVASRPEGLRLLHELEALAQQIAREELAKGNGR